MRIVCLRSEERSRAQHIADAMVEGFRRHGIAVNVEAKATAVNGDLVVGYGWRSEPVFTAYQRAGARYLYLDLGFWERKPKSAVREGYHKVALDSWCPRGTMCRGCPSDRFDRFGIPLVSGGNGSNVIVAGMSAKAAGSHGLAPHQWEQLAIGRLQPTGVPIVYRPKPSWHAARPLPGAAYSVDEDIKDALGKARLLVTHHSNAAVDAIVAGVPVYCETSVGALMSTPNLTDVVNPRRHSEAERRQFLADVAYCQWNVAEMRSGACWDHVKGLL